MTTLVLTASTGRARLPENTIGLTPPSTRPSRGLRLVWSDINHISLLYRTKAGREDVRRQAGPDTR